MVPRQLQSKHKLGPPDYELLASLPKPGFPIQFDRQIEYQFEAA